MQKFLYLTLCSIAFTSACSDSGGSGDFPSSGNAGATATGGKSSGGIGGAAGASGTSTAGASTTGGAGSGTAGAATAGTGGSGTAGAGLAGSGGSTAGAGGTAGSGTAGSGTAGSGTAGSGTAGSAGSSPGPEGLVGWATDSACGSTGTTGGGDGPPTVTVKTVDELQKALKESGPKVIAVSGKITTPGEWSVSAPTDKTLIGVDHAEITGGMIFRSAKNVIVKNIAFTKGSTDTVELTGCTCVWIDHCSFSDGKDGNLDIVRQSDLITVSWSKFFYTVGHDHMLSNLNGNADDATTDRGKLRITFHHNWWGAGAKERMPRVRFGQVHVFNNYYKYEPISGDAGQASCVAAGFEANLLVENNYFDGSNNPIIYQTNGEGSAAITEVGNEFAGTTGSKVSTGTAFKPTYAYKPDAGASVKDVVKANSGPK